VIVFPNICDVMAWIIACLAAHHGGGGGVPLNIFWWLDR
jgi:hypothetical protein